MKRTIAILLAAVLLLMGLNSCKAGMVRSQITEEPETAATVAISKTPAETADGLSYFEENKLKVVSYNVRCSNDPDGNSIRERAPRLIEVLEKEDPDLIGMQEFTPKWEKRLKGALKGYDFALHYRSASNYEGTPIYWKRSKFKLLDSGYFWLSETPDRESKGWGADYWRICSWVQLKVRATGKTFYYFNTHYDFTEKPQVESAKLLIDRAEGMCGGDPMILTGDFNMEVTAKGYQDLTAYFADVNTAEDPTPTYTDYGKIEGKQIDFCFVTPKTIAPASYRVMTEKVEGGFVSDHYGLAAEVILK